MCCTQLLLLYFIIISVSTHPVILTPIIVNVASSKQSLAVKCMYTKEYVIMCLTVVVYVQCNVVLLIVL